MTTPGTYKVSDGSVVKFADAVAAWVAEARPILVNTARGYNEVVTYGQLGELVQSRTGIRTKMLLTYWIGQVLERVAKDCHRRDDRLLTCLCVRQDGTVGDGYASAVSIGGQPRPDDPEIHAANERLACYRQYAADLPHDGGHAALTRQEHTRRSAVARRTTRRVEVCPTCNTALPANGRCDYCN